MDLADAIKTIVADLVENGARAPFVIDAHPGGWVVMELDKYLAQRDDDLRDTREEWEITRDMTIG